MKKNAFALLMLLCGVDLLFPLESAVGALTTPCPVGSRCVYGTLPVTASDDPLQNSATELVISNPSGVSQAVIVEVSCSHDYKLFRAPDGNLKLPTIFATSDCSGGAGNDLGGYTDCRWRTPVGSPLAPGESIHIPTAVKVQPPLFQPAINPRSSAVYRIEIPSTSGFMTGILLHHRKGPWAGLGVSMGGAGVGTGFVGSTTILPINGGNSF